jgi:ribosomal protein S18 acetylase RimI-like enzyme
MIKELLKSDYEGYPLTFSYTTSFYYEVVIQGSIDHCQIELNKKPFDHEITKSFDAKLFEPYYENAVAFGIFDEDILAAIIEVNKEDWSNRLRITELLVLEEYRRQGYGHRLMEKVKDYANQTGVRAIILETQSRNSKAIAYYLKEGFTIIGLDTICYGNKDIENKEVRLEFGFLL